MLRIHCQRTTSNIFTRPARRHPNRSLSLPAGRTDNDTILKGKTMGSINLTSAFVVCMAVGGAVVGLTLWLGPIAWEWLKPILHQVTA